MAITENTSLSLRNRVGRSAIWVSGSLSGFFMILLSALLAFVAEASDSRVMWTFDEGHPGTLPSGFTVGTLVDGRPAGAWTVIDMKVLPSVLRNLATSPSKANRMDHARIVTIIGTTEAPSPPQILAQLMMEGFQHAYKIVLIDGTMAADLDLEVSFLPMAGLGDMASPR